MTYSERFPHPEGSLPEPPPPEPPSPLPPCHPGYIEWLKLAKAHNDWILTHRKHAVAKSVDALKKISENPGLTPAETIAMFMGMSWLDGAFTGKAEEVFSAIFQPSPFG